MANRLGGGEQKRPVNCEFYRVILGKNCKRFFPEILREMQRLMPHPSDLNWVDQEDIFRLHDVRYGNDGNAFFTLLRIRPNTDAQVINIDSDIIEDLDLEPGKHLMDFTSFGYFKDMQVLVVARRKDTVSAVKLATYIRRTTAPFTTEFLGLFNELIMIDKDLEHLYQSGDLQAVTISLDIAASNNLYSDSDDDMMSVLKFGQSYQASALTVTLNWGRTKIPLDNKIKYLFGKILNNTGLATQALKYKPAADTQDSDKEFYIDLLGGKLRNPVMINYVGKKPTLSDYYAAIIRAYEQKQSDLRRKLQPPS